MKTYRAGPCPAEQWQRLTETQARQLTARLRAARTCFHCKTVYRNGGAAWRCEHYHERTPPVSKPKPALRGKIANLRQLRAMDRAELRANTCRSCEATYTSPDAARECAEWHRQNR